MGKIVHRCPLLPHLPRFQCIHYSYCGMGIHLGKPLQHYNSFRLLRKRVWTKQLKYYFEFN
jgi:hypothetical protein